MTHLKNQTPQMTFGVPYYMFVLGGEVKNCGYFPTVVIFVWEKTWET